ncbi:YdeI/OmpD-associated family protein [Luteimonas deserti]|uniref:YdeI/OmpD-associated family protein n=1 Tax=Luteimonas deserti TaxID=2752306 RepID=A0A7Z0QQR6_9GAMM|nr:YdeI/OmpD-associated family protein [Luteimonas deserti]NYZ61863.1 YdeI/OmpD-associated family protein [Luteimonas deserti]
MTARFFETPLEFRAWLAEHHAVASELDVGFHKVGSGRPSMTWPESVDEALAYGWIDGVRRRIDATSYRIRFTPRRPGSIWSRVNLAKVEALIAQQRMQPAGLAAYAARKAERSGVYAFERSEPAALAPEEMRAFESDEIAWQYFAASPPGYRNVMTHWIVSAKRPDTRARRLARLIEACAAQRRLS